MNYPPNHVSTDYYAIVGSEADVTDAFDHDAIYVNGNAMSVRVRPLRFEEGNLWIYRRGLDFEEAAHRLRLHLIGERGVRCPNPSCGRIIGVLWANLSDISPIDETMCSECYVGYANSDLLFAYGLASKSDQDAHLIDRYGLAREYRQPVEVLSDEQCLDRYVARQRDTFEDKMDPSIELTAPRLETAQRLWNDRFGVATRAPKKEEFRIMMQIDADDL